MSNYIELKNICKAYAGVQALEDVNFKAYSGEVCALVGENGAGKSTLLKILSGEQQADSGCCFLDGEELNFGNPVDAIKKGISIISQERQLVPHLTVMENIFMEDIPTKRFGIVAYNEMEIRAREIIDRFNIQIEPNQKVRDLSVAHQQMVEIMKAYRRNSLVVAFDEPTAPLSDSEIEVLFSVIRELKSDGKIILYVSHRLNELQQLAERVVVLKDGQFVIEVMPETTSTQQLVYYMVGRDLGDIFNNLDRNSTLGEVILSVEGLRNSYIKDVSFELRKGEILGIAGLVGAGRTEVVRALFGADKLDSGVVTMEGTVVSIKDPSDSINLGIGLCPEDRKEQGLILRASIKDNISMPILQRITRHGFIDVEAEKVLAEKEVSRFNIKTHTVNKLVVELSGGNQQKVILARWLAANPKVLILDEPTKGVDAGVNADLKMRINGD